VDCWCLCRECPGREKHGSFNDGVVLDSSGCQRYWRGEETKYHAEQIVGGRSLGKEDALLRASGTEV